MLPLLIAVSPSGFTALAVTVLAGAALAAVFLLLAALARLSRAGAGLPPHRVSALRERASHAAFIRQRDPDAAGRPRPRAPSAAPAAASC